jgi:hypothetical protein
MADNVPSPYPLEGRRIEASKIHIAGFLAQLEERVQGVRGTASKDSHQMKKSASLWGHDLGPDS